MLGYQRSNKKNQTEEHFSIIAYFIFRKIFSKIIFKHIKEYFFLQNRDFIKVKTFEHLNIKFSQKEMKR